MKKHHDYVLFSIVLILIISGLAMLSSASIVIGQGNFGKPYYYLLHQIFYGFTIGLAAFLFFLKVNYRFLKKFAVFGLILSFILISLVFIKPFGVGFGGAQRWVKIAGLIFQPSEFLKLASVVYLAAWLSGKSDAEIKSFSYGFLPFLFFAGVVGVLLAAQPDIGTLGILFLVSLIIFFASGARLYHIILIFLFSAISFFTLVKFAPYRINRLMTFFNPQFDPSGIGYQINQALIAIGSGGFWGLGFGAGRQKYYYLPEPAGDSIFAIIAEEMGLIGAAFIVLLFILLVFKAFKIASRSEDKFGRLLACGIGAIFGIQSFVNIGSITGLIPLTGVPLPFISFGGTALVTAMAFVGILANISRD